ncbi:26S proteasome non-ATPase regulatory subunit 12 homolog A-like protein [Tanacetum coccineum]
MIYVNGQDDMQFWSNMAVTAICNKQCNTLTRLQILKLRLSSSKHLISAGKIFVEIDRARLIKRLAKINEEQGQIAEAADLMQEIAVETFGAMAKTEKIAFIL